MSMLFGMRFAAFFPCLVALQGSSMAGFVDQLGARWDAAPRIISGNERSLDGGLRFSMEGGTFESYRDRFTWDVVPSVSNFQQAVNQAFNAWTTVEPATGLGTNVSFRWDSTTSIVRGTDFGSLNINGAEIDLLASDAGVVGLGGLTSVALFGTPVTLTTGVSNYASSVSIQGVDLHMNSNSQSVYTLDAFRRVLTHEIGHAIGLGDVDLGGSFLDDNYDASNPVATLTNSWAALVNPLDPANSVGLSRFNVPAANFALNGVDILMESNGLGLSANNPLTSLVPLRNDDYGMRQYLYPTAVPEPGSIALVSIIVAAAGIRLAKRSAGTRSLVS